MKQAKPVKPEQAKEIQLTLDANGVIVWKLPDGTVIEGLKKEHFLSNAPADKRPEALKSFYLYMVEAKKALIVTLQDKVNRLLESVEHYSDKASGMGKTKTPAEVLQAKYIKLQRQMEASKKAMLEMGLEIK